MPFLANIKMKTNNLLHLAFEVHKIRIEITKNLFHGEIKMKTKHSFLTLSITVGVVGIVESC